jgi:CRISPR-associated endoribonuclease Cas6
MLASFAIEIRPEQNAFLPLSLGSTLHALFLALIADSQPELARQLHSDQPVKPFTVSPLEGKLARTGSHLVALSDNAYWFRFTVLTEEVFTALNKTLLGKLTSKSRINLDGNDFSLASVILEPTVDNPWGGISSFEEIYEDAAREPDITFLFYSPTAFRHKGMNLPFPASSLIWSSLWGKWNAFAPITIDSEFKDYADEHIALAKYNLRTRMINLADAGQVGFTGKCKYLCLSEDPRRLKQINALADFAFYCGTGAKTTMGMGQTRRIK